MRPLKTDPKHKRRLPDLPQTVAWRLFLAQAAMAWERLWPSLWPALALLTLFISLSLMGIWDLVPEALQALVLFAVIIGTGVALWRNLRETKLPERREGLRRLEVESGLKHRPLSAFAERPVAGRQDPRTRALWRAHRERVAQQVRQTGIVLPRTDAPRHDPYALRLLFVLILGVALLMAGTDWGARLRGAVSPLLGPGIGADVEIDAWVDPPAYTGLPQISLVRAHRVGDGPVLAQTDGVEVPVGSTLVVRLSGFAGQPVLELDPIDKTAERSDAPVDIRYESGAVETRGVIEAALTADLSARGRQLGKWRFEVRADEPPFVEMPRPPETTGNASLRFFYQLGDDYGVTKAEAHIRLIPETAEEIRAVSQNVTAPDDSPWPHPHEPVTLSLPVSPLPGVVSNETAIENLAAHPWAGRNVTVQIMVEDGAGQRVFSDPARIALPERVFLEPLAQAFIELRDLLAADAEGVYRVAAGLDALTREAEQFFDDTIVYLGMRSAYWRLAHEPRPEQIREVFDLLWDLALHVEDGDLSESLQRLRQLQEALAEALQRNAPASEIRQLMAQLREALDRYLVELAQQTDRQSVDPNAQSLSSNDLDNLLQSIEQLADLGEHGRARQMLAELQQILERLQPSGGRGRAGGQQPSPQEQALNQALSELSDIIAEQRRLLDQTYRNTAPSQLNSPEELREALRDIIEGRSGANPQKRRGRDDDFSNGPAEPGDGVAGKLGDGSFKNPGPEKRRRGDPGTPDGPALAEAQDALRERLDKLLGELEGAGVARPDKLGGASQEMGEAESSLRGQRFSKAFGEQQSALDALRSGAEELAEDVLRRQGRRGGGVAQSDPLWGDNNGNGVDQGQVGLPERSELQRAREILEELRRRAGERERPKSELEYFDRLLRQF